MSINVGGGELKELKPRILVMGIGGAGGNAINSMIESGMQGVEFVAVNTDAQDLRVNKADAKIQIGMNLTKGLGAGAKNDIGQAAADESLNEIVSYIQGSNMIFITAGMGGGTGTGASHVIARAAKELNILTVGVTTLPFSYEGPKRMRRAIEGLEELKKHLDTVIVVPNQNLFKIANEAICFFVKFWYFIKWPLFCISMPIEYLFKLLKCFHFDLPACHAILLSSTILQTLPFLSIK